MIREMYYRWRLKNQKKRAMFEVAQDVKYIETCKHDMLKYDESKARRRMAELKAVPERNPKEEAELDTVLEVIAQSKAVKNEWNQSKKLLDDLENYISTI